jgi:predicted dinucleotide-binding enzyme
MRIGIIGAGFAGRATARLAVRHRYDVMLSNLRYPTMLANAMVRYETGTTEQVAAFGDVILVAVPFTRYRDIPSEPLIGKIVLDACNYLPERDGQTIFPNNHIRSTSELVAEHFRGAKVVKALNAILENEIEKDARPVGLPDRRALPIAGDLADAKAAVSSLLDQLGFDVVDAGPLSQGWRFEPGRPAYCVRLDRAGLKQAMEATLLHGPVEGRPEFDNEEHRPLPRA